VNSRVDIGSLVVPYREGQEVLASLAVLHKSSSEIKLTMKWNKTRIQSELQCHMHEFSQIQTSEKETACMQDGTCFGDPHSRRKWRSVSETTIPGGSLLSEPVSGFLVVTSAIYKLPIEC
jgi:hypothetical protein